MLEGLDQHDWSPVQELMEPGQGKEKTENEERGGMKEEGNDGGEKLEYDRGHPGTLSNFVTWSEELPGLT